MDRDTIDLYAETIPVPGAVRFPIELIPPADFRPEDPATWPRIPGRLEWVNLHPDLPDLAPDVDRFFRQIHSG